MNLFLVPYTWMRHGQVALVTAGAALMAWAMLLGWMVVLGPFWPLSWDGAFLLMVLSATIGGASTLAQPFVLLRQIDLDIARATLANFQPALPLSLSGVMYGVVGIAAGWLIYEIVKAPLGLVKVRRPRQPAKPPAQRLEPTLNCDLGD